MQVVVGGVAEKAEWVEEFVKWMTDPQLKGRFVFVPGGGSDLLRAQAIGADICLNCPLPKKEACGTSDQRSARMGGVNVATRSGGPPEYIEDGKSGFLVGPYENDAVFYEQAPKDILDKLRMCSEMYYSRQDKGDNRWLDMMFESYMASRKVTSEAMAKRYAVRVYVPSIRIKRLYFVGREIAKLVLQTKGQGNLRRSPNILFVGPQGPLKNEIIEIVKSTMTQLGLSIGTVVDVPFQDRAADIVVNTDFNFQDCIDTAKVTNLLKRGVQDEIDELKTAASMTMSVLRGGLQQQEDLIVDIASAVMRPKAFNERLKNLSEEERALVQRFRNYPGFERIPSAHRHSFFSVLQTAKVLEDMGATIVEFEWFYRVGLEGTAFEDNNRPEHKRTGVETDILISLRDKNGVAQIYLVEVKSPKIIESAAGHIRGFFHPAPSKTKEWGQKKRYEVCANLLGCKVILAVTAPLPGYPLNQLVPVEGEDIFYILVIGKPLSGVGQGAMAKLQEIQYIDAVIQVGLLRPMPFVEKRGKLSNVAGIDIGRKLIELQKQLENSDAFQRVAAVRGFAELSEFKNESERHQDLISDATDVLSRLLLDDESDIVKRAAAITIGELGALVPLRENTVSNLLEILKRATDPIPVRKEVVRAIAKAKDTVFLVQDNVVLVFLLNNIPETQDSEMHLLVVNALGNLGLMAQRYNESFAQVVLHILADINETGTYYANIFDSDSVSDFAPEVREEAIKQLVKIYEVMAISIRWQIRLRKDVRPTLYLRFEDMGRLYTRIYTIFFSIVAPRTSTLVRLPISLRLRAAEGLQRATRNTLSLLLSFAGIQPTAGWIAEAENLRRFVISDIAPLVYGDDETMIEQNPAVKRVLLEMLGEFGDRKTVNSMKLLPFIVDDDGGVCEAAAKAISKINDPQAVLRVRRIYESIKREKGELTAILRNVISLYPEVYGPIAAPQCEEVAEDVATDIMCGQSCLRPRAAAETNRVSPRGAPQDVGLPDETPLHIDTFRKIGNWYFSPFTPKDKERILRDYVCTKVVGFLRSAQMAINDLGKQAGVDVERYDTAFDVAVRTFEEARGSVGHLRMYAYLTMINSYETFLRNLSIEFADVILDEEAQHKLAVV
ncbi:MAG: hypothetical protein NC828_04520, partial [Candidatus Omnitrophica bacterium]|nr:hypothetical protein [Candidatus Omnitrophota bacterium]